MSGSLNKVMLIGRLGQDPEVRNTQDGRSLCTFSIATSESWNDKNTGEKREKTEWHRIVVFNEGLVNIIQQYVKKGALKVKKVAKNNFRLSAGPYSSINTLKKRYFELNKYGFEDLDIKQND